MTKNLIIPLTEETETRLRNIMEIRGLDSLEAAVDYAFVEGERTARIGKLYANPLPHEAWGDALDLDYHLETMRNVEIPRHPRDDAAA